MVPEAADSAVFVNRLERPNLINPRVRQRMRFPVKYLAVGKAVRAVVGNAALEKGKGEAATVDLAGISTVPTLQQ